MNPKVIYEDGDLIVCHKQAGTAVQTRRLGQPDMESLLKNYRVQKGEPPYIGVVHRLDQPVEGVMVFAKNAKAAAALSAQIRERGIGKYYYAVACADEGSFGQSGGKIPPHATLTDFMSWDKRTNIARIAEDGKKAVLEYTVCATEGNRALFDIALHTGRHHQIRLQMAHLGCPILGDAKYGGTGCEGGQLALCAYRLEMRHPSTGKLMSFCIEPENPAIAAMKHIL